MAALTDLEMDVLAFERQWWRYAGAKESAVRERFGWSITRHVQVVTALLDRPEAMAYDAPLVKRLQRLRDARRAARSSTASPLRTSC